MMRSEIITVRYSGGAYVARSGKVSASCTMDTRSAVERVAMKLAGFETNYNKPGYVRFEETGIAVSCVNELGAGVQEWVATWRPKEP